MDDIMEFIDWICDRPLMVRCKNPGCDNKFKNYKDHKLFCCDACKVKYNNLIRKSNNPFKNYECYICKGQANGIFHKKYVCSICFNNLNKSGNISDD